MTNRTHHRPRPNKANFRSDGGGQGPATLPMLPVEPSTPNEANWHRSLTLEVSSEHCPAANPPRLPTSNFTLQTPDVRNEANGRAGTGLPNAIHCVWGPMLALPGDKCAKRSQFPESGRHDGSGTDNYERRERISHTGGGIASPAFAGAGFAALLLRNCPSRVPCLRLCVDMQDLGERHAYEA